MQKSDRRELNERFTKVYTLLEAKALVVKNDRVKSKAAFAEKIGTKGHIIDQYIKGTRQITYEQVKKLCLHYSISEAFMFQGIGKPFYQRPVPEPKEEKTKGASANEDLLEQAAARKMFNILFTSVDAFASNTIGVDVGEENQYFHIPGLEGELVAFNINGDSMNPTIGNGDLVICAGLSSQNDILDNEIYAIVTNESVRVKRLQRIYNNYGQWTHLKLISDNYIDYDPVTIKLDQVRKVYRVVRRLTDLSAD